MFDRLDLKLRARAAFKKNYGVAVFVGFILSLVGGSLFGSAGASSTAARGTAYEDAPAVIIGTRIFNSLYVAIPTVIGVAMLLLFLFFLINSLLLNPIKVGAHRFFLLNRTEHPSSKELLFGFGSHYGNIVRAMFLRDIVLFLWTLLFVIPGIVKSYSYRMVPYLLAEDPALPPFEAMERSKYMMDGYRLSTFILDLSFLGWNLLRGLTFGISGVFFSDPYFFATNAELYALLKTPSRNSDFDASEYGGAPF